MRDLHAARYPKGIVIIQPRVVPQSGKLPWVNVPQNNSPSPRPALREGEGRGEESNFIPLGWLNLIYLPGGGGGAGGFDGDSICA